jgi:hypothetical protein
MSLSQTPPDALLQPILPVTEQFAPDYLFTYPNFIIPQHLYISQPFQMTDNCESNSSYSTGNHFGTNQKRPKAEPGDLVAEIKVDPRRGLQSNVGVFRFVEALGLSATQARPTVRQSFHTTQLRTFWDRVSHFAKDACFHHSLVFLETETRNLDGSFLEDSALRYGGKKARTLCLAPISI